jgi:hypothetical protein
MSNQTKQQQEKSEVELLAQIGLERERVEREDLESRYVLGEGTA